MQIPYFKATLTGKEEENIRQVLANDMSFAGKGFIAKCESWFNSEHELKNFFLTKSCSHSLELAALVLNIQAGDEVIMPSYAFVACANAIALRGATSVFVDVNPQTMMIDEQLIEAAITPKTKAILTLNYGGAACNYKAIQKIAEQHKLFIIEDNAHGTGVKEDGNSLGSFGDISCFSFDHLKNICCGQGGGIAINNEELLERFFINYEFGTNRRSYFKTKIDRYEWKGLGANFPLSELNAAMLYTQLQRADEINSHFVRLWNLYYQELMQLKEAGKIELPLNEHSHNGHCFYIKTKDIEERSSLIKQLEGQGIQAQFHYTPLHSSEFGKKVGRFSGEDRYTTAESSRLLRLPLFYSMTESELNYVVKAVKDFYR